MARLPNPGGDSGNWGTILNDYLRQIHNDNGTLKDNVVGSNQLQDNSVTANTIAPGAVTKTTVGLTNVDNTSDTNKPVSTAQQTALDLKADASALATKLNTADLDTQTASKITTNGTATQAALVSDFIGKTAPAYAGARTRPFDPLSNIYGSATARSSVRRALGFGLGAAKSSLVNILISGDSYSAGWKANNIGVDDWATNLIGLLREAGYPITGGWIHAGNGMAPGDVRWTFSGTWNRTDTTANYAFTGTAGAYATFTSIESGTILEFAAFSTGTTLLYSIDGGGDQTWNLTANQVNVMTVTGLTSGTHSVKITRVSGTVWVCAARCRNTTGLSLTNASIFGSHTADWLPTAKNTAGTGGSDISWLNPYKIGQTLVGTAPRLVLLCLIGNDAQHTGQTLAAGKANLGTIVNAYRTAGTTVLQRLYTYPTTAGIAAAQAGSPMATGTSWDAFLSAVYDISDTYDTALIDHSLVLGDTNTLEAAGMMHTDHLHLLTPGQAAIARADFRAIQAI